MAKYVNVVTNLGEFTLELYELHAPKTVENFITLCKNGYYRDVVFHRIIAGFMIQGGDPTGTGRGGESCWGGKFDDETTLELRHTGAGILSMANSGPNTNGSQFFITLGQAGWLDNKHTIFWRVSEGMKTIKRIGSAATDAGDKPLEVIKILSTEVL